MGECLWEVAERCSRLPVDLLGQQPDIVGVPEEALERRGSTGEISSPSATFDCPEAADAEGPLPRRQTILGALGVAGDQSIPAQSLVDTSTGRGHPRVPRVGVSIKGEREEAGVQVVAVQQPGVTAKPLVIATLLD